VRSGSSLLVAVLLLVAVVATSVAAALALGLVPPLTGGPTPSPTPTGVAVSTTPPASPSPSTSPSPVPSATPQPSPSTPAPSEPRPTPGGTYIVREGDTLFTIGELFGVPWELIAQANNLVEPYYIYPEQELIIPAPDASGDPCQRTYVVQPGDTFYDIAYELAVSPEELAALNGIEDINDIQAGQVLLVPGGDDCPSPSVSPSP
jgi:LysM repeat protein